MPKLSQKIRTGLKKNPAALAEEMSRGHANSDLVADTLTSVTGLVTRETELIEERKKLSRQVGAARKEGKDPANIIAQVSAISAEVKQLSTRIEEQIADLESHLEPEQQENADTQPERCVPLHLLPETVELDYDIASLELSQTSDIDTVEWQSFVDSISHSNVYHHAGWCDLIASNFGHKPHYITCRKPDGELCGVFPTVHLKSRLFGSFMVSMPYFNYGGPLSKSNAIDQKMMEHAAGLGAQLQCTHLETREVNPREHWLGKQTKVTMILPLPDSDQELDKRLGSKVRAQVNRAAKEQLEFSTGGKELLDQFYQVFSHNMRDLGTPVYSKRFFASILDLFPEKARITLVRHEGRAVAAGFLLGYKDKLEIPWASSLRKANPLGANMYMYRKILSLAIEQGYEFFDFGRSTIGASTHKYKKQWGAIEHPLYWHYWLSDSDELPELNPDNPKYKMAISAWQRLPLVVANTIGPHLVRNLP